MLKDVFEGYPIWTGEAIAAAVALTLAYLCAVGAGRLVKLFLPNDDDGRVLLTPATRRAVRLVRLVAFVLGLLVFIFPALRIVGLEAEVGLSPEALGRWAVESGLRIGLILLLAWFVTHAVGLVAARLEATLDATASVDVVERAKRARTLSTLLQNTTFVLVSLIATLMVLRELNVDITPILTGAGIVGLAVGFGAQSLVKDIISGFFIILENQVRVGDVANIDGTGGLVERITLRTIVLRDISGTVHVIPNGSISRLSNLTKDFSYYVIDMGVAYKEDTDHVVDVMKAVGDELLAEPKYGVSMLGPLEVIGVNNFGDSSVDIRVRLKTIPLKQWEVGREFRRRVKKAFDAHGIEIPFPYRTLVIPEGLRVESRPLARGDSARADSTNV